MPDFKGPGTGFWISKMVLLMIYCLCIFPACDGGFYLCPSAFRIESCVSPSLPADLFSPRVMTRRLFTYGVSTARLVPLVGLFPNSCSGLDVFDLLGAGVSATYCAYIFFPFGG
jgi:hypothetical protein